MKDIAFNWITKDYVPCEKDVRIIKRRENDKPFVELSFSNHALQLLGDAEYIAFAVMKNRIYFKKADEKSGCYKVAGKTSEKRGRIKFPLNKCEDFNKFYGEYTLTLDGFYDYFFIEKEEEK